VSLLVLLLLWKAPPPFVVPEKGQKKNMVSNLEIGGNVIVGWLVIIVYLDWKTFYT